MRTDCQGDATNDCQHAPPPAAAAIIDGAAHLTNKEVDEELDATKQRYRQTRQKQQLERDLWDVIKQYKELEKMNESATKVNTEITKEKSES